MCSLLIGIRWNGYWCTVGRADWLMLSFGYWVEKCDGDGKDFRCGGLGCPRLLYGALVRCRVDDNC